MWVSRKKAKAHLRKATNLSIAACERLVDKHALKPDGARLKIDTQTVRELIDRENRVKEPREQGVMLSIRTKARIRAMA